MTHILRRSSRRTMLALAAAVLGSACSRDDAARTEGALQRDATLAARLRPTDTVPLRPAATEPRVQSTGAAYACAPAARAAATGREQQAQADLQLQFAREAELAGDARGARDALRRAARLDPTNPAIAQRLAHANESLHDVPAAVAEYCRLLAIAPSAADSAAATERLQLLSSSGKSVAVSGVRSTPSTPRPTRPAGRVRVAGRPSRTDRSGADSRPTAVASNATSARPGAAPESVTRAIRLPDTTVTAIARDTASDAVRETASAATPALPPSTPAVDSTSKRPSTRPATTQAPAPQPRRSPSRVNGRNVLAGAAVGAVMGTIIGRDVRGAVVGAAAGGVLGGIVGPRRTFSGSYR